MASLTSLTLSNLTTIHGPLPSIWVDGLSSLNVLHLDGLPMLTGGLPGSWMNSFYNLQTIYLGKSTNPRTHRPQKTLGLTDPWPDPPKKTRASGLPVVDCTSPNLYATGWACKP